ncbi:MAG: adenylate/guanylate cyclase domain-containing protein [Chitinophagaceae bacterium]
MEENIAILMADLSGYTALTETHGSVSAADLIDKYIGIVEKCLVGDSKLHERTGDEVMIVSTSPDFLLSSAYMIMKATANEDNFLQVHGGLHYGKVLKRCNSYFGSTINLTSRIAAKANPGTFWCSEEFVDSLTDKSLIKLQSKGKHSFKNINEEKEIAEIVNEHSKPFFIDPVCRMQILDKTIAIKHPERIDLFFCSSGCLDIFRISQLTDSSI